MKSKALPDFTYRSTFGRVLALHTDFHLEHPSREYKRCFIQEVSRLSSHSLPVPDETPRNRVSGLQ